MNTSIRRAREAPASETTAAPTARATDARAPAHADLPIVHHAAPAALEILSGVAAGVVGGVVGGPPGMVVGAVLGGAAGVAAVVVLDEDAAARRVHDQELDDAIGVTQGDLGNVQPLVIEPDEPPPTEEDAEAEFFGEALGERAAGAG